MSTYKLKSYQQIVESAKTQVQQIEVHELYQLEDTEHAIIIDIRETSELSSGIIENAICIPRGILEASLTSIAAVKEQPQALLALSEYTLYLYCRSGARSALAAQSLQAMGLTKVYSVAGGSTAWQEKGYKLVNRGN